jgi:hypothetical protein
MAFQNHIYRIQARADFEKARNRAFFTELLTRLFRKNNALLQFDEVKHFLEPHGMVYRGVRAIPLNAVVGSESRYEDFDRNFMPRQEHTRDRWENVDIARLQQVSLPPIKVYKINDFYFVRDGNHRVSVAHELGQEFIDAEVVELFTRIPVEEMNEKELLNAEGWRYLCEKTGIDAVASRNVFRVTNPWGYYRLLEHILTYQYFLAEAEQREIGMPEAVHRWYRDLYHTVTRSIRYRGILKLFPGRTPGDLYIWVMDHWHFLKEKYGDVALEDALTSFASKFGKRFFQRLWGRIREWILSHVSGGPK